MALNHRRVVEEDISLTKDYNFSLAIDEREFLRLSQGVRIFRSSFPSSLLPPPDFQDRPNYNLLP